MFRVNGDNTEACQQFVAKQPALAGEDGFAVQPCWHAVNTLASKTDAGHGLWNRKFREADCELARALFGRHSRRHPLQRRRAARVESHPLTLAAVDAHLHAQTASPGFQRNRVGIFAARFRWKPGDAVCACK